MIDRHDMRLDRLEERTLLSANLPDLHLVDPAASHFGGQVVYLNFDGATDVTFNGPKTVRGIDVPKFSAGAGDRQAIIDSTVRALRNAFRGSGVVFTTVRPVKGAFSTVYIGGTNTDFAKYGSFSALAEKVDVANADHGDNAFVFSDRLLRVKPTIKGFVKSLPRLIKHEVGHLLGYAHDEPSQGAWSQVGHLTKSAGVAMLSVPHYGWYYGCTPTAVGVVMGYWDMHGVDVMPGDASEFTQNVKDQIAGPAHIISGQENQPNNPMNPPGVVKYYGNGDWHNSPSYPNHENNPSSLADYLRTVDAITYIEGIFWGTGRWLQSRGSTGWTMWQEDWDDGAVTWSDLTSMIDNNIPFIAAADSDGNGTLDHTDVVVGYNANTNQYAIYSSRSQTEEWYNFGPMKAGTKYGIHAFQYFLPPDPVITANVLDKSATEGKADRGRIRISRTGANAYALTVNLNVTGTAINGKDYKAIPSTMTIPAGKTSVLINLLAYKDGRTERRESVVVKLAEGDDYQLGSTTAAKVLIAANKT